MMTSDLPPRLPPPPASEAARTDWLRLMRSHRVGPATFYRLLADHGSARAALAALPEVAQSAGVSGYRPISLERAESELRAGRRSGARLVAIGEADYPPALARMDLPPPLLWMLGQLDLAQRAQIALVGTRQATSLGLRMARSLAEDLGRAGYGIVSGLARGIDHAAHQGALTSGTIAVMPGGVDVLYPPENAELAEQILENGLRISDQPMGLQPQSQHFVRRNRLIAGLAEAVVVVEAPLRSGALITARDALDAGREVMAVPGHPMDSRVSGCNQLIRDGALLVRSAADVLEVLDQQNLRMGSGPAQAGAALKIKIDQAAGASAASLQASPTERFSAPSEPASVNQRRRGMRLIEREASHAPDVSETVQPAPGAEATPRAHKATALSAAEKIAARLAAQAGDLPHRILSRLGLAPLSEDELSRDLGLGPDQLAPELLALELEGQVERRPGGVVSRLQ